MKRKSSFFIFLLFFLLTCCIASNVIAINYGMGVYEDQELIWKCNVCNQIEMDDIFLKGKQRIRVKARSLFCFWAVHELGMTLTEIASHIGISVPGVGYSVERGRTIARENDYRLIEIEF